MKRFYKEAKVVPADAGFAVELDGKPLRTPEKRALSVATHRLAAAIADEWQGQDIIVKPLSLPLTRLVSTALDRVTPRRAGVITEIAKYGTTDLLCYRAAEPHELVERQQQIWQPLLDWAEARIGAAFAVTQGVTPIAQTPATLAAIERAVAAHDALQLVALHLATTACGSVVLALALLAKRISAEEAFAAAQLDETFQIERWGEDPEQTKTRAALKEDIALAARFAALLRAD
ncbi:MAG TPA: ATP12 family protein [Stellaceae bacterium]|jgi:chaperone required for assembly of F1-ATPase